VELKEEAFKLDDIVIVASASSAFAGENLVLLRTFQTGIYKNCLP